VLPLALAGVAPDIAAVVDDDVEDDVHASLVGLTHQLDQVFGRAEAGVDVEEVLDAVAVVARGVVLALLEGRADPDGGAAEALHVIQPARNALQLSALEVVGVLAVAAAAGSYRGVEGRVVVAIVEAVDQELVDELVAPVDRRREYGAAGREVDLVDGAGRRRHAAL
jgi:hypothetical protein